MQTDQSHRHVPVPWAVRWKPAVNAFAVTFADRMPAKDT